MSRIYGENKNINKEEVKNFFNERANKKFDSLMTITSFQNKENLNNRQKEESEIILKNIKLENKKILEIGCGLGRWAEFFNDKCNTYLGIDYSKNLIDIAKKQYNYHNCHFQVKSALDINNNDLIIKPPFDIIFITGLLIYLNDDDILQLMKNINNIKFNNTIIYIRETISVIEDRLTLKNYYSEDLNEKYNAIYRTKDELLNFFKELNMKLIKTNKIHESLNKHNETGYRYFIFK